MKIRKFTLLFTLFLILAGPINSYAATRSMEGTIDKVQFVAKDHVNYTTNTVGMAFIHMSELPNSCGDANYQRVVITTGHPLFNAVVSGALAAKATKSTVTIIYNDVCTIWSNAWDFQQLHVK